MAKFEVGEIVEVIHAVNNPSADGQEAEIISHFCGKEDVYWVKSTVLADEKMALESQLRKKKPPQEKSTWEEV